MDKQLNRRGFLGSAALTLFTGGLLNSPAAHAAFDGTKATVYRNPGCGCCENWVLLLENAGFAIDMIDTEDLDGIRASNGVPADLAGCHTALLGGYVVEGHVPVSDITRMLKERPNIAGIAVPGMPLGSPGMEAGSQKDEYSVIQFGKDGSRKVFSVH